MQVEVLVWMQICNRERISCSSDIWPWIHTHLPSWSINDDYVRPALWFPGNLPFCVCQRGSDPRWWIRHRKDRNQAGTCFDTALSLRHLPSLLTIIMSASKIKPSLPWTRHRQNGEKIQRVMLHVCPEKFAVLMAKAFIFIAVRSFLFAVRSVFMHWTARCVGVRRWMHAMWQHLSLRNSCISHVVTQITFLEGAFSCLVQIQWWWPACFQVA